MTDEAAREAARTVFDRPLVVEAGAGTGKTTTLIARLCTWCLGPGWARVVAEAPAGSAPGDLAARVLDAIVAITFTEAAAAEMAARFGEALVAIASRKPVVGLDHLPVDAAVAADRARHLLAAVDRLAVSTIHAWCSRVLSAAPVQAGLHPQFQVDADGSLLDEVVHEVVVDWFTEVFGTEAQERDALLVLADRSIGSDAIAEALTRLATDATPRRVLEEAAATPESLAAFFAESRRTIQAWLAAVEPYFSAAQVQVAKALELIASVRALRRAAAAPPSPAALVALCAAARDLDGMRERLGDWRRGRFTKNEERLLAHALDDAEARSDALFRLHEHLARMDPELFDAGRAVLAPLLARVDDELRRRGVVTFDQLLRRTRDLLAEHPQVLDTLRRSLHLLHVDEFQDTDGLQCDIVALLALEGDVRPALFVVGDPKQSIYGWRSADLVAYQAFVDRLMDAGGLRLTLDFNRRSVAEVLHEVEAVVAPLMVPVPGYQPVFQPLVSHRGAAPPFPGERGPVEYWIAWDWTAAAGPTPALVARSAQLEAEAIAADLVGLRETGLHFRDVGLLMRSATDLDVYLEALRRAGIPYVVERDRNYFRRREIVDAASTLRAVLEPADVLALLAFLRSPPIGVPDAALLPLWRRQLPARLARARSEADLDDLDELVAAAAVETRGTGAPGLDRLPDWPAALVAGLRNLVWLRAAFETLPADRFVEELRARIPSEPVAAGRYLGAYRVANLQRFHADLVEALVESRGEPQRVIRALRRGVKGWKDAEEARPADSDADAVRVMTIHKAKGLEFRHVYVVQTHKGRREALREWSDNAGEATSAVQRRDGGWELRVFGARSLGYDRVIEHEERVERLERLRLLYVALTRARDRLVVLGSWPKPDADLFEAPITAERARNLLELVLGRVGGHPTAEDVAQAGGRLEVGPVRWRLPVMTDAPLAELPRPEPVDPTPRDLEARLARRAELQGAAAARMARPTSAPASDAAHKLLEDTRAPRAAEGAAEGAAEAPATPPSPLPSAVGTAVHRALELMDPAAAPDAALRAALVDADAPLCAALPEPLWPEGRRRAEALLRRFVHGALGAHFRSLRAHLVARELPTLAPPPGDDGPVGFFAGAVDLVHLDPATGELVVVDYKTDAVRTDAELDTRVAAYRHQAAHYVAVLQAALGLAAPPRMELWFLSLDRRVS